MLYPNKLLEKDSKGHQRTGFELVPERPVIECVEGRLAMLNSRSVHGIQKFLCNYLWLNTSEGS